MRRPCLFVGGRQLLGCVSLFPRPPPRPQVALLLCWRWSPSGTFRRAGEGIMADKSQAHQKYVAEFVGTLALVLIGCGAIVIGEFGKGAPVGILPIAMAFGLTV